MSKKSEHHRIASARDVAVEALVAFDLHGRRIGESLASKFGRLDCDGLSARDRGLASEIAYGTMRMRLAVDYLIRRYSRRGFDRIDGAVLNTLRAGLYQYLFMTGIPDFAAFKEAVAQVRDRYGKPAAGFVNGILRTIQRDVEGVVDGVAGRSRRDWPIGPGRTLRFRRDVLPDPAEKPGGWLASAMGFPEWLVQRWLRVWPFEVVQGICHASNRRPVLTLRVNPLRSGVEELTARLVAEGYDAIASPEFGLIQLSRSADPVDLPGYAEGVFSVQDASAAAVVGSLPDGAVSRWLDLCAAPGGKTTHLAERFGDQGDIVASDIDSDRLARVELNARRLGLGSIRTIPADGLEAALGSSLPMPGVLLDVPCSNTGVLARRVEARHRVSPSAIRSLVKQQAAILETGHRLLADGGWLLYSTCSLDGRENERQVGRFLERHGEFRLVSHRLIIPSLGQFGVRERMDGVAGGAAAVGRLSFLSSHDGIGGSIDGPVPTATFEGLEHDGGYLAILQRVAGESG